MTIWTGEIAGSLSMGGYFRERLSYDDGLNIHAVIARDLRTIIASAFLQAEASDQISTLKAESAEEKIARLTRERDEARTALAESERKRVEAEKRLTTLIRLQATPTQETPHVES